MNRHARYKPAGIRGGAKDETLVLTVSVMKIKVARDMTVLDFYGHCWTQGI